MLWSSREKAKVTGAGRTGGEGEEMSWERPAGARWPRALRLPVHTVDFCLRMVNLRRAVSSGGTGLADT